MDGVEEGHVAGCVENDNAGGIGQVPCFIGDQLANKSAVF